MTLLLKGFLLFYPFICKVLLWENCGDSLGCIPAADI